MNQLHHQDKLCTDYYKNVRDAVWTDVGAHRYLPLEDILIIEVIK